MAPQRREQMLSREVLRWLMSLDLAYSIKNVKREMSNGFLVAEVFSRYFDRDVQMHSFSNGTSLSIKRDNWRQLKLLFQKWDFIIPNLETVVESIIRAHDSDIVPLINSMYTFLTARKVSTNTFERPDAPRGKLPPELLQPSAVDLSSPPVLGMREAKEPEDFAYNDDLDAPMMSRTPSKVLRGQPRVVGAEVTNPLVTVQQVNISEVDRGIVQLRANRELQMGERSSVHSGHTGSRQALSMASGDLDSSAHGIALGAVAKPVSDCLDEIVAKHLRTGMPEGHVTFVSVVKSGGLTDSEVAAVVRDVGLSAPALAESCSVAPSEFGRVAAVLCTAFSASRPGELTFAEAVESLERVGVALCKSDEYVAHEVCCERVLSRVVSALRVSPGSAVKFDAAMRVLYAFVNPDVPAAHVALIKRLRGAMTDLTLFVRCLATLVAHEPVLDGALVDLYSYYCSLGLGLPSPAARAACIAIVPHLVSLGAPAAIIEPLVPALERLALGNPVWWETRAQLIIAAASLLTEQLSPSVAEGIVVSVFVVDAPVDARVVGLVCLAPVVHRFPTLLPRYLNVLLSLPTARRRDLLLGEAEGVRLVCRADLAYGVLRSPALEWNALAIATMLGDSVQQQSLECLEAAHIEVLVATTSSMGVPPAEDAEDSDDGWEEVFAALEGYLIVALNDPALCSISLQVLRAFVFESSVREGVLQQPSWIQSMKVLFSGDGDLSCQEEVVQVLLDFIADRRELQVSVAALLDDFSENAPDIAKASPHVQRLTKAATE